MAGRKIQQIENHGRGPEVTSYGYDDADRLTSATYPDGTTTTWTYDDAGNRKTETISGSTNTYVYNEFDELLAITDASNNVVASYTYDANGNQTSKATGSSTTGYRYTSKDELLDVSVDGTTVGTYRYDDLGRMIWGNNEFRYWDGRTLVAETDNTGALLRSYTHGAEVLRGTILGQQVELYTDGLGSVGLASGASNTHYRYLAWGGFRNPPDCTADPMFCANELTFTGYLYHPESGLFYAGARFYDHQTGRFLTHDPVEGDALNPPSLHQYLYAFNSPAVYTDFWGLYATDAEGKRFIPDPVKDFEFIKARLRTATGNKGAYGWYRKEFEKLV